MLDAGCAAAPPDTGGRTDPPARGKHARAAKTFLIVDGFARFRLRPDGRLPPRDGIGLTANSTSNDARGATVCATEFHSSNM